MNLCCYCADPVEESLEIHTEHLSGGFDHNPLWSVENRIYNDLLFRDRPLPRLPEKMRDDDWPELAEDLRDKEQSEQTWEGQLLSLSEARTPSNKEPLR